MESRENTVQVGLLTYEMLEWELHALRGLVTVMRIDLAFAARQLPDDDRLRELNLQSQQLVRTIKDNQQRALLDPDYRHRSMGSTRRLADDFRELELDPDPAVDPSLVREAICRLEKAIAEESDE